MSNATPETRGTGDGERRRRRSRGGKGRNRNRQNQDNNNSNPNQGGQHRSHGGGDRNRGDRNDRGGDRGDRGPRPPRKEFKPAPLTLWQKILKIFGLYKEPVRPPRERKETVRFEEGPPRQQREPKSNVRIAKQSSDDRPPREDRGPREERAPREDRQRRSQERGDVASARIYLGNLSYDCSEEDLKDLFKGVGTVRNVEIVYNRRTHKSKGYGFVDMLNVDEAKRSVEVLHDQFFMGRKLVVSGAKTKEHEDALKEESVAAAESSAPAAAAAPVPFPVSAAPVEPAVTAAPEEAAAPAASATTEEPTA